jgi:hypothetical protein
MASRIAAKEAAEPAHWPDATYCAARMKSQSEAIGAWIVSDSSFRFSALRFVIILDWIVSNARSSVR